MWDEGVSIVLISDMEILKKVRYQSLCIRTYDETNMKLYGLKKYQELVASTPTVCFENLGLHQDQID